MFTDDDSIDSKLTVNNLLTPGISDTISRAEPYDRYGNFAADLFPHETYPVVFNSVKPTFKIDDEIVFFYFDEPVSAGKGNIVISSSTDTRYIDVNDSSQVKFGPQDYHSRSPFLQSREFGVVTISPSADLLLDTAYTIQVADGVFLDSEGKSQAGFNNASFETTDSSPNLYSLNRVFFPVDENIELHFDEAVKAAAGNIVISNGTDVRTIAINDTSQVAFAGDTVTINPVDDLLPDSDYVLQIESGVITDIAGHPNTGLLSSFYKTAPAIPQPLLVDSNPKNNSPDFKVDNDITLRFNEAVKAGTGYLVLSNGSDTRFIAIDDKNQVAFDGDKVIIDPSEDLIPGTTYTARMASGVITDKAGIPYDGFTDATFSTIDPGPLFSIKSGLKIDNVKTDQDIRFFLDEEVVAGNGNIVISNGSDIRTINVRDADQVTFGKGIITLNPIADLNPDSIYTVQIPAHAITDTAGNPLSGGDYQIILGTIDSAPLLVGSYPNNEGNIKSDQPIVLRFDEKIVAGSGGLVLRNGADTRSIAMTDSSQVTFNGRSVIIDPTDDLMPGAIYTAYLTSGAITDSEGNAYVGFSDASFTVGAIS
ncbi:MAG: Ig-like domain-containing protein [Gammaproteobacteria bacterium]|nr:MAG: Ig-like domain-containing protein [Gammaproteobacteria bacterium]